jgi:cell division protein FtsI (penicillin-binding protein 3)
VATPLNLLTTCSVLLGKGKKIHPFVVKKILDKESGAEIPLSGNEDSAGKSDMWSDAAGERMRFFFRSQARQGEAGAYFFRDDILVSVESGGQRQFLVNDLLFVTIPAGTHNLSMLLVVQRPPVGVNRQESDGKKNFEQLVEEKVERISILQQIANSVADVVEPEIGEVDNYQGKNRLASQLSGRVKTIEKEQAPPGVMPDLKGLSLRKSLRLLQGLSIELHIQGTGRVIDQKPRPGTSFKGITECILILEKQENIAPEKLSQRLPGKD